MSSAQVFCCDLSKAIAIAAQVRKREPPVMMMAVGSWTFSKATTESPMCEMLPFYRALGSGWRVFRDVSRCTMVCQHRSGLWVELPDSHAFECDHFVAEAIAEAVPVAINAGMVGYAVIHFHRWIGRNGMVFYGALFQRAFEGGL